MAIKHIVGFSGGIDSQACAGWCLERFGPKDVILVNSDAGGNEHPLTTEHVHWYSEHVHPVVCLTPIVADMVGKEQSAVERHGLRPEEPLTFDLLAKLKGAFPARRMQFCTYHLKLMPQARWVRENATGLLRDGFERYVGVRADESRDRSDLPEKEWDEHLDCWLHRPILHWTKQQCFDFVRTRREQINPLYTMGFARVGCAPCVNANKDDIREWAARFPEMIDKVREWERRVGKTFFRPVVKGGPLMWVDDMVAWARTTRGGQQLSLPYVENDAARGACSSKYGLCE